MDNTFLREAIEKIEELTDSAREPHVVEIAGRLIAINRCHDMTKRICRTIDSYKS